MDMKTVDTAIAQAKADVDDMQADGMIVDAWGIMRAILMRLLPPDQVAAEPVAPPRAPPAPPAPPPAPPVPVAPPATPPSVAG